MSEGNYQSNLAKIRALVKAQEELLQAQSTSFFDTTAELLAVVDLEGFFININESWSESLGWSKEELMNTPFLDFIHDEDRAMTVEKIKQSSAGEVVNFRNRFRNKNGKYVTLSWRSKVDEARKVVFSSISIEKEAAREAALGVLNEAAGTARSVLKEAEEAARGILKEADHPTKKDAEETAKVVLKEAKETAKVVLKEAEKTAKVILEQEEAEDD